MTDSMLDPTSLAVPAGTMVAQRYLVRGALGHGGGGSTYRALDTLFDDEVALKLVPAATGPRVEALVSEFATLAELHHPRLLEVRDLGVARIEGHALPYYTATRVPGTSLSEHADGNPWESVRRPLCDALEALRFLHLAGIRHGDFKADNVLVDSSGRGVLIDLGCSRALGGENDEASGTPGFLAPEVLAGERADARADLFAVGVTLDRLGQQLPGGLPREVQKLARRLCRPRAADRPSDVGEVLEALGVARAELPLVAARPARLLGRGREIGVLDAMLEALLVGRPGPRVLVLSGPEGIGRTRLMRVLRSRLQLRTTVHEGNATSRRGASGLLARSAGLASRAQSGGDSGGARRGELEGMAGRGVETALRARVALLRAEAPVALVLDDVHRLAPDERACLEALLRITEVSDPYLVLLSTRDELGIASEAVHAATLAPLSERDVARWLAPWLPSTKAADARRSTGGIPAHLEQLALDLAAGKAREGDLVDWSPRGRARDPSEWQRLSAEERGSLGWIAAGPMGASDAELERAGVRTETVSRLLSVGWLVREGPRVFASAAGVALLDGRLDPVERASLHARWLTVRELEGSGVAPPDEERALLALHQIGAGRLAEATTVITQARDALEREPLVWARVAEAIVGLSPAPADLLILAAEIRLACGQPDRALAALARALRRRPSPDVRGRARRVAATAYLRSGAFGRAERLARRALADADGARAGARGADVLARVLLRQGRYAEARDTAVAALSVPSADDDALLADLHDDVGVACAYLGDSDGARDHLQKAAALHLARGNAAAQARSHSYLALEAYRRGDTTLAVDGYRRALEIAERHGLSDALATAALNLGTVSHQRGDWGRALQCYERGLRSAVALGKAATEATLRFDLAKLYLDVGIAPRAESSARRAEAQALAAGLGMLAGACRSVLADAAALRRDWPEARAQSDRARARLEQEGAIREVAEVELERSGHELAAGALDDAERALEACAATIASLDASDLHAAAKLARARVMLARDELDGAGELLDEAAPLATRSGRLVLEAEIEATRAHLSARRGAPFLAERHAARARELWERVAASLPAALREPFWAHPARAGIERSRDARASSPEREQRLLRLLAINRRLSSCLEAAEVLEATMDAAIELTHAERGFLILAPAEPKGALSVPVARNLDREKVGRSHLKFSKGIAEKVLATGDPVVTTDAQADDRFAGHASVHAMQLSSVLCVPIRAPEGVLGALYLDNRFLKARFREDDVELLLAFADQVAIALRNARLHAALAERTRELETERRRVDALLKDQADEIDRLHEQVRAREQVQASRYEYASIVGRGPAMQRVLAQLDRVVEQTVNVLIEGESGTGKELVARALHANGPRRDGPFVSVNCGALPETLLESELFGHVRGAFTGATTDREGLFVAARGGTLLLDELGETTAAMQVKLLRVLQEREVRPVGSTRVLPVDIRLVCATNRRLRDEVAAGRFREDLYYRVAVVEVVLPPLRERAEDIPVIAEHVLARVARELGRPPPELLPRARRKLVAYGWPGNVRQLENVLTKAVLLAEGGRIQPGDLQLPQLAAPRLQVHDRKSFERAEAEQIRAALRSCRWNVSEVARTMGIPRPTLYRKLARYGLLDSGAPSR